MQFTLPTLDTIFEIHDIVLEESGGLAGIPHPDYLEAVLHRPQNYMAYGEECDIYLVAALLLEGIAKNHAFADGNKRTALITMLMTYNMNTRRTSSNKLAYSLSMNRDFEELVLKIAKSKIDVKDIRQELTSLIQKYSS